jgi:cytochrome P450
MDAIASSEPHLVGARPRGVKTWREKLGGRRVGPFGFPERVYDAPFLRGDTPFVGPYIFVADPTSVKRVLVDNVANYPKMDLEQRAFRALFGQGLLGTDGELWRRHRRIMAPSFQPQAVESYAPAMAATADAFIARWRALKGPVDMAAEMSLLTLQIISKTMFSTEDPKDIDLVAGVMAAGLDFGGYGLLDILPVIGPKRFRAREARMAQTFRPMDDMVYALIRQRQAGGANGRDLLARLIAATDSETGARLTPEEVRDEVITIYIAGHETTAVAMSWIWYLLSQHPLVRTRLEDELAAVLGGRMPGQEDAPKLVYTRRVVDEAMRLYPPAPGISMRIARGEDKLGEERVPAGARIGIFPWVLQRHNGLWRDPERFDPDRWEHPAHHRFAYIPFGAGPRVCIGQLMAVTEIVLILATLAQHFRVRLAPDARVGMEANITLRATDLRMTIEPR